MTHPRGQMLSRGGGGGPGLEGQLGCVEGSPSEEELNRQIRANGP